MKAATFLIVAVALVLGACAFAQDEVNPLSIKLGIFGPSDDIDELGNTWFYGEIDYGFGRNYDKNYAWHVSLGWTQKSKTFTESYGYESDGDYEYEDTVRIIPLTVGMRYDQPQDDMAAGLWYFGWGVGVYFGREECDDETDSETAFGGCLYGGYEWPNGFFVEGKYQMTDDFTESEVNANGYIAVVGVKIVK